MWAREKLFRLTFPKRVPQMSVQCPRNTAQHLGSVHRSHNEGFKSSTSIDLQLYLMAPFGIFFQCMMNQVLRRTPQFQIFKPQFYVVSFTGCFSALLTPSLFECLLLQWILQNWRFLSLSQAMPSPVASGLVSVGWQLSPSQLGSHYSSYSQVLPFIVLCHCSMSNWFSLACLAWPNLPVQSGFLIFANPFPPMGWLCKPVLARYMKIISQKWV